MTLRLLLNRVASNTLNKHSEANINSQDKLTSNQIKSGSKRASR